MLIRFQKIEPLTFLYMQNSMVDDFARHLELYLTGVLQHEFHPDLGLPCCDKGLTRSVVCYDCLFSRAVCSECFIKEHIHNPFHWAQVWTDKEDGSNHFERKDISCHRKNIYSIPLGHNGSRCPHRTEGDLHRSMEFTVVAANGIHKTSVEFCGCLDAPGRAEQLLHAKLFPSSTERPCMAFTFSLLTQFRIHSFESKVTAHDYVSALIRLTDESMTHSVSVSLL